MLTLIRTGKIVESQGEYSLTPKSYLLLKDLKRLGKLEDEDLNDLVSSKIPEQPKKPKKKVLVEEEDSGVFEEMIANMRAKLLELTGKKQAFGIGDTPLIPSLNDFIVALYRFKDQYENLWDLQKIGACLLQYVERCCKTSNFSPSIKYFIFKKDAGSRLADYLESGNNPGEDDKDQHNITNTKDIFE